MKKLLALFLFSGIGFGDLSSPFDSSVEGLSIPNSHVVSSTKGKVLRGAAPSKVDFVEELIGVGITDVIIFKNEIKDEVEIEKERLKEAGISANRIQHLPFRWKGIDYETACEETVSALKTLLKVMKAADRKLFFHCTVGEDRTGYLAGLLRLMLEGGDMEEIFQEEMCENGYEAGNPQKPMKVVSVIRKELTPLFLKMAYWINEGKLSKTSLSTTICQNDPSEIDDFASDPSYRASAFQCDTSSKLD